MTSPAEGSTPAHTDCPDPRRAAWRADLAAEQLRGVVDAPRYIVGEAARVARSSVAMRRLPDASLAFETELLFGEDVLVYERARGWAWVQSAQDRYVGYVPADALISPGAPTTHRVHAIGTFIYPRPDIKSPPTFAIGLNARVTVSATDERFAELATGGFVIRRHLSENGKPARDFVEVAERMTGVPYLWGGRTRLGLDCSGLVQLSLEAAGFPAPRDSDMQKAEIGADVLIPDDLEGLKRGDLVFWPGHVGIMTDGIMLVHANAHHMAVVVEPLEVAVRRIERSGARIAAVKRIAAYGTAT